jgi:hypothetical protein
VFQPDPSIQYIPVARDLVVALVESINQAQVSIPGKQPQAVQGFLAGVRNGNGSLSIYVSLFLPRTGENVVYVHEHRQVTLEEYREVEIEGLHFLESMGFMLDNLNFRNMSKALQDATLKRIPLFSPPRPPEPSRMQAPEAKGGAADGGWLARLLASF